MTKKISHLRPSETGIKLKVDPWKPLKCKHQQILIYEDLSQVECGKCGEKLNPIWILSRWAKEETLLARRIKEINEVQAKLDAKIRTKCEHCGKFTKVNI